MILKVILKSKFMKSLNFYSKISCISSGMVHFNNFEMTSEEPGHLVPQAGPQPGGPALTPLGPQLAAGQQCVASAHCPRRPLLHERVSRVCIVLCSRSCL